MLRQQVITFLTMKASVATAEGDELARWAQLQRWVEAGQARAVERGPPAAGASADLPRGEEQSCSRRSPLTW